MQTAEPHVLQHDRKWDLPSGEGCGAPGRLAYYRLAGVGHTIPGAPVVWSGLGGTSSYDSLAAMWAVWRGGDPAPVAAPADVHLEAPTPPAVEEPTPSCLAHAGNAVGIELQRVAYSVWSKYLTAFCAGAPHWR